MRGRDAIRQEIQEDKLMQITLNTTQIVSHHKGLFHHHHPHMVSIYQANPYKLDNPQTQLTML